MGCKRISIVILGMVGLTRHVHAVNASSQASLGRRQLASCMTKQMNASRTISYNDAAKVCKLQQKSQNDNLAVNNAQPPARSR